MDIYTDGACDPNPGCGGWAFVVLDKENVPVFMRNGASLETTNNRMELKAILEAVIYGSSESDGFTIYSDSEYCVKVVKQVYKAKKNLDLVLKIRDLIAQAQVKNVRVEIEWVKGHAGNVGNEIADEYAGQAMRVFSGPATPYIARRWHYGTGRAR